MLVTMVLKRGSLAQWFGMLQLVEKSGHSQICGQWWFPAEQHTRGFSQPSTHSHIPISLLACRSAGQVELASSSPQIVVLGHWEQPTEEPWFSVEAEDYLERGTHPDGLCGKLSEYWDYSTSSPRPPNNVVTIRASIWRSLQPFRWPHSISTTIANIHKL